MIYSIAKEIACGLSYLHKRGIHGDIKSRNILLTNSYGAKISDFGSYRFNRLSIISTPNSMPPSKSNFGTLRWKAPELLKGEKNTRASDVYSMGMIYWELLTRKIPYAESDDGQVLLWIQKYEGEDIPDKCKSYYPQYCRLIADCFTAIP